MSTPVQWAKFDIPDVNTENVTFDRLLTLRIDDDASLAREILQQDIFKEPC